MISINVISSFILSASMSAAMLLPSGPNTKYELRDSRMASVDAVNYSIYAKLPACAPIKGKPAVRAKSPDVLGATPSTKTLACFLKSDVAAGKKLLSSTSNSCFACHGPLGAWNPSVMIDNIRAQGDGTLKQANINAVNSVHLIEMAGSAATALQLKQIRAYFKCSFNK